MNNFTEETTDLNCPQESSQIFYAITSGLGVIINTLLLVIIRYNTTPVLQQYSIILKLSCVVDIYSSISQFLTQSRPYLLKTFFTFSLDGIAPKYLSETFLFAGNRLPYIMIPEFVGCYYSVCFCVIPFIYRYFVMCWNRKMKKIELAACMFILFVLIFVTSFSVCHAASGVYDINVKQMPKMNPNCTRLAPQFNEKINATSHYHAFFRIFFYTGIIIIGTFIITIACAIKIHLFLSRQVGMNTVQKRIQKQVSNTLIMQAVGPLLSYYIPQTILTIMEQTKTAPNYMIEHSFYLYAATPILNPLASIMLISAYRRAFFNLYNVLIYGVGTLVGMPKDASVMPFGDQSLISDVPRNAVSPHCN